MPPTSTAQRSPSASTAEVDEIRLRPRSRFLRCARRGAEVPSRHSPCSHRGYGRVRSYSMANAPTQPDRWVLIKLVPGEFSGHLTGWRPAIVCGRRPHGSVLDPGPRPAD